MRITDFLGGIYHAYVDHVEVSVLAIGAGSG